MARGGNPSAEFAVIGGSGTFGINFPEDLSGVDILAAGLVF